MTINFFLGSTTYIVEDNRKLSMLYTTMQKQEEEEFVKTSLLATNSQGRFSKRKEVVLKLYL